MAQESSSSHTDRAVWTNTETDHFLLYLFNNQDKVGDTGNFKDLTYNGAAEAISEYLQHGPQKTGVMCKTKWASLKQTYNAIQKYCQQSGVHWNNTTGANIQGDAAASVWNEYVSKKGNSVMHLFRISGYQPHTAIPPPLSSSSSTGVPTEDITTGSIAASTSTGLSATAPVVATATSIPTSHCPASITSSNKCSHSDMMYESTVPLPSTSVSMQREPFDQMLLPLPLPPCSDLGSHKKAKTTSGCAQTRSGIGNTDAKMAKASSTVVTKATTAVAMMGFQSSVNHLTDVISECMVYPEDWVMDQCSRAMHMLQVEDADWSFEERLMMQQVFSMDPAATDIYMQTTDKYMCHAFILSTAQRLGIQPTVFPPGPN
ncbi:hypothetical protein BDR07DRAFT_1481166 [Suillus spraguei]|nr:hypothetical protein BDR07DRAFT_1481166 [Suillus spraguei]